MVRPSFSSTLAAGIEEAMKLADLTTPALVVDARIFADNLAAMTRALPGRRLRPHVKAHKCTALARRQAESGHVTFTCATVREMEGMAAAGFGEDLLLANEVLDTRRLGALDARVTVAVDSAATVAAAADGGVREILVDVNVGLPRCGCAPEEAGKVGDLARRRGLEVRGVMGYEGHAVGQPDRAERLRLTDEAMAKLRVAHRDVGGEVVSAGGTGTFDMNDAATEIQAGSYALMDTAYAALDLPFRQAFFVLSTVLSVSEKYAVADCGLKGAARLAGGARPGVAGPRGSHRRLPRAHVRGGGRPGGRHLGGGSAGLVGVRAPPAPDVRCPRGTRADPRPRPASGWGCRRSGRARARPPRTQ
jgi:D-serine deaminase-like pyridoxal phosphate-dependent protein